MQRVKIMGFSYMISAFMDCSIAASRGIGKSIVPMVIVILGSCVFRGDLGAYTIFVWIHTIPGAVLSLLFLLGDYICGGGALFQAQLSAAGISELSPGTRTVKIRQLFCRQIRFWRCCAVLSE